MDEPLGQMLGGTMGSMGLKRLGEGIRGRFKPADASLHLIRVQELWPVLMGPVISQRSHPIQIKNTDLIVGCWDLALITALREACQSGWPEIKERLDRWLSFEITKIVVIPSDPPRKTKG